MRAIVTKEFRGTPDLASGERFFAIGEVIYGDLAEQAVKDGNAAPDGDVPAKKKAKG